MWGSPPSGVSIIDHSFLIQTAQVKNGAQALAQSDAFIVRRTVFLDSGLDDEYHFQHMNIIKIQCELVANDMPGPVFVANLFRILVLLFTVRIYHGWEDRCRRGSLLVEKLRITGNRQTGFVRSSPFQTG